MIPQWRGRGVVQTGGQPDLARELAHILAGRSGL